MIITQYTVPGKGEDTRISKERSDLQVLCLLLHGIMMASILHLNLEWPSQRYQ
jgi:hypothetical protein